ncbi:MAG TPA: hypothetical protein VNK52_14200 [Hyphomicrobiaceae bacterium]|nr:hypothetical protein [Hyphomicrobiaceae bacterium]
MGIFRFAEVFEQLTGNMASARKVKADETKVASWVGRLVAVGADRPQFESAFADLQHDSGLTAADVIAIARAYNKGGRRPASKAAALALIRKRFVEIVRTVNKHKVAEKARPW